VASTSPVFASVKVYQNDNEVYKTPAINYERQLPFTFRTAKEGLRGIHLYTFLKIIPIHSFNYFPNTTKRPAKIVAIFRFHKLIFLSLWKLHRNH